METYRQFRRTPKYLNEKQLLIQATLPLIAIPTVTGIVAGSIAIEMPLLIGCIMLALSIAWTAGVWIRGLKTGRIQW